ncbi:MAG: bifunctional transaldolase/phosoglucose isomerase [Deltaproteobacteria bacterium]|nr:MAG: bifunctional transaldolase/phosoglucose isomerase [Deltaproteobacteria bacterium]
MVKLHELAELGQAIWLDYIRRSFITSGDLQALIEIGLRGVTSNPTIFDKTIAGSVDYDETLKDLVEKGKTDTEIYEELVLDDIRRTADVLLPVYEKTRGLDGYVSLEVNPALAFDTDGTVKEAWRLFTRLDRPNVMIKVPATHAGIPAIQTLIGEGVNVNVTLIFSLKHYLGVAEAYISGLEGRLAAGGDVSSVASVASFFVSRVDTAVDLVLDKTGHSELQGKIAIANAEVCYARFQEIFTGDRWERLAAHGARKQRVLWGSTGTKNPSYSDTLYVDSLIGPDTVNTVPPGTLQAFLDHGQVGLTLHEGLENAQVDLVRLSDLGINIDTITQQLQEDGVAAFEKSFNNLMASIREKRKQLITGRQDAAFSLGSYQGAFERELAELRDKQVMSRIWAHDHTVWKPESAEITNRLGWLHSAEVMGDSVKRLEELTDGVRSDGYTHGLLLGMGGSSLAPEVFRNTFGVKEGFVDMAVLDTTDPGAVLAHAERLDPSRTLFVVSTKSGTTVETLSFFKFFYNWVSDALGPDKTGDHFIAITDPGTPLVDLAADHNFRATFLNDPNIGGRYSVLSYFGLVPAALIGVDIPTLLDRAMTAVCNSEGCNCPVADNNNGARLGVVLGELNKEGRDKVTLVTSPQIAGFADWVEQLIAESTGKEEKGILPVVGEPVGPPAVYGKDRVFVHVRLDGDETHDAAIAELERAELPVVRLFPRDRYDLGGQFFLWEMAIAVAGHCLGINPFDQPNVEAAKILAREITAEYKEKGSLPAETPSLEEDDIAVYGDVQGSTPEEALTTFIKQAKAGSYVALQAYIQPTVETSAALQNLRLRVRDRLRLATTVGYGPRFLHSTGQLHKGDAGNGLFIQFTDAEPRDASIPEQAGSPDSSISFGVLKAAQAMGDRKALLNRGRKIIRFHLGKNVVAGLKRFAGVLA